MRLARGLLLLLVGAGSPAWAQSLEATVQLGSGPRKVTVLDLSSSPWHAKRMLRVARRALPHVEAIAGFPFPEREVRIEIYPSKEFTGGEVGYLDHLRRTIKVHQSIDAWLLVHELAHYWFLDRFGRRTLEEERWLIEGLCHHTAVEVCRRDPTLGDAAWVHHVLVERSLKAGPAGFDPPLSTWRPAFPLLEEEYERRISWYGKAYGFFHLLRARLGPGAIGRLNRAVNKPVSTRAYLRQLCADHPDVVGVERGWVLDGVREQRFSYAMLTDADGDGLSAGEEAALGTSDARRDSDGDGFEDGVELVRGTNPSQAASRPPGRLLLADGKLLDWPEEAARLTDAGGDAGEAAAADLTGARAWVDGGFLCVAFEGPGPFDEPQTFWCVGVDTDGDEAFEQILGCSARRAWTGRVLERFRETDWHPNLTARVGRGDGVLEVFVPLRALGVSGPVRLFPYTVVGRQRTDDTRWLEVTLP